MEHVAQSTGYYTAVSEEPEEATGDGKTIPPSRWQRVKRWAVRKFQLLDRAIDQRIVRWGYGG